jgi:hypothetical protein
LTHAGKTVSEENIEKEELSLLRDSFTSVRQALLFKENTSSNNTNNQESLDKEGELSASIKTLSRYIKNIGDKALTVSVVVNNKNRNIFFIV